MRINTLRSIKKIIEYDDGYGLYSIDIKYNYNLERIIKRSGADEQSFANAIRKECLPFIPIKFKAPKFGCSAFSMTMMDGRHTMGRNYDFKLDTSAMLVRCNPKNGYSSVAFAALDNVKVKNPMSGKSKLACLLAPFLCLDGVNVKGVSIAVLTLDSEPTHQNVTGKQFINTSLAIRLVLDRADTTEKAIRLLRTYNMYAICGRDYHFYITDSTGDGRVVEFDCESELRETVVTQSEVVTNFYILYKDKVCPNQKNGIYGHGRERYDSIMSVIEGSRGNATDEDAWKALKGASQLPSPTDITSNTQWSILFENTDPAATICIRRHWDDRFKYVLKTGEVTRLDQ